MPWTHLVNHAEVLAVHAAYVGFGKILYFGGDEHDASRNALHQFNATRLFDCNSLKVTAAPSPGFDAFCAGHAFLGTANQVQFLVAGGTMEFSETAAGLHHKHFAGLRDSAVYSSPSFITPSTGGWSWNAAASMNEGLMAAPPVVPNPDHNLTGGRWYPTLMTLANGSVIAFSGHPGTSDRFHNNDIPEVFSADASGVGQWRQLAAYSNSSARENYQSNSMPLYPRVHLLPSGDIICTSPIREKTMSFIPEVGPYGGVFTPVCNCPPPDDYPGYGWGSVLLPLSYRNNYRASVLMCGGASEVAYRLDLKDWSPSTAILNLWAWRPTSPRAMRERRLHANATLLPTGEVLVTGGIDAGALDLTTPDARGVREPEIYDPYADKWSVPKEPASEVRNYHSVALLMPDGRVWTAGSDHDAGGGLGARNLNTEIFAPWYYGDPDRPYIKAAPSLAYPNETIYVESTHAKEIERVVLLRCGSCTHAFNPDQRLLELEFKHPTGDALLVKLPPDNFILPPGPYFIYTIRRKSGTLGLPSYGTDIYIVPERTPKDPPSEPGGH